VLRALFLVALLASLFLAAAAPAAAGDSAPFDLSGPSIEVAVTRGGKTLPIGETPNLSEGDQLWVKADLPPVQSAHFLLVGAFLRGATDPPPESWFFRAETWKQKGAPGLRVTVPQGAQQVLLFLVPETGGDFKTLVNTVRGRPGAFVRAAQDLTQASLDRSRLEAFLTSVHEIGQSDPERLQTVAPLLARSLSIKLDSPCLERPPAQQASCLTQGQDSLVLSDEHNPTIAHTLTSGSMADLVQQLSVAPQAGAGAYSPYVGAVMDIVRIMDGLHTAQFRYLPALTIVKGGRLSLLLNAPPAFHNPKSVLVVALPGVEPSQPPLLRPVDPHGAYCASRTPLVLPVEGAPLVFSTAFAHDLTLQLRSDDGKGVDLPLRADPETGGLLVDTSTLKPTRLGKITEGAVRGAWGFDAYSGPTFRLQLAQSELWEIAADHPQSLIAGHGGAVRLRGPGAACVESVMLQGASGDASKVDWKTAGPDVLEVTAPPGETRPGPLTLLVKSYGVASPTPVALRTFAEPSRLDGFTIHAGDSFGALTGTRLNEVDKLSLMGADFRPDPLAPPWKAGDLPLYTVKDGLGDRLKEGDAATARVTLKDGRQLNIEVSMGPPRPRVTLIAKSIQAAPTPSSGRIQLTDHDAVALSAILTFSLRTEIPAAFTGREEVQVETPGGAFTATLTLANGLTLEDSEVAIATLDTGKVFGPSAAGRLRYRIVEDGSPGDWQPLATLVRLPRLHDLKCPPDRERPCKLVGSDLFLLDALAGDPGFEHEIRVPEGFPGSVLSVPHPTDGRLFVKLRDDPTAINPVVFSVKASALARPAGGDSGL
jgi:hypothetical protein